MTEFDPDKVEWPQEGFAHPAYEHKMPPGSDHPANVAMYYDDPPLVVPAEVLRQAEKIEKIEKAADVLAEAVQLRVNSELPSYLSAALSNYLKVKESKREPDCEDCYVSALSSDEPPCPAHEADAAGVADADLDGLEVHINGSSDLSPDEAKILGDAMKRAYVLMKERQGMDRLADARLVESARDIRWRERIEELAQKWEYNYPQMAAELRSIT